MPPIMANSKDGQGQKDKYLDTSREILSQALTFQNLLARLEFSKNGSPRSRSQSKK